MRKLLTAQDLLTESSRNCWGGFNTFIDGGKEPRHTDYGDRREYNAQYQGYQFARKMAEKDGICFTHPFKCGSDRCHPFMYGGFFVCNGCNNSGVDKDWWKIQVEKDGNEFCCHGLDFVNLQESNNYAFGNTFSKSIENYGMQMIKLTNKTK